MKELPNMKVSTESKDGTIDVVVVKGDAQFAHIYLAKEAVQLLGDASPAVIRSLAGVLSTAAVHFGDEAGSATPAEGTGRTEEEILTALLLNGCNDAYNRIITNIARHHDAQALEQFQHSLEETFKALEAADIEEDD